MESRLKMKKLNSLFADSMIMYMCVCEYDL